MSFTEDLDAALVRRASLDPDTATPLPVVPTAAVRAADGLVLARLQLQALLAGRTVAGLLTAAGEPGLRVFSEHEEATVSVDGVEESYVTGGADWAAQIHGWFLPAQDWSPPVMFLSGQGRLLQVHPVVMPEWCTCENNEAGFLPAFAKGVDTGGRLLVNLAPLEEEGVWLDVHRWLADFAAPVAFEQ